MLLIHCALFFIMVWEKDEDKKKSDFPHVSFMRAVEIYTLKTISTGDSNFVSVQNMDFSKHCTAVDWNV